MTIAELFQKQSKGLRFIAILSTTLGLFLLFTSLQFFLTWKSISASDNGFMIINKPVNILSTLGFSAGFSDREIEEIGKLVSVKKVGAFSSNDFRISLGNSRLGFRTEAFFESVPDNFIDEDYPGWQHYSSGDKIPILLSADYLALYNFGFAPSQGLPQFTPATIGMVNLDIDIFGNNGNRGRYKAYIAGFSKKLNSIIVPESFMKYANSKYGSGTQKLPSRLILEIDPNQAIALNKYNQKKGYESNTPKVIGEKMSLLVNRTIFLIAGIGILVLLLSILILYLSYKIIIEENTPTIKILYAIGYSPNSLIRYFTKHGFILFSMATIIALVFTQTIHYFVAQQIRQMGFDTSLWLHPITLLFAFLLLFILLMMGKMNIKKTMNRKYE